MIGQTICHYKILDKLGEGGMGVVYKAQDTTLDRLVALKFLPNHVSTGSGELERFIQEAKAAAGLNHPNICTIYGIEQSEEKHFIAMEFVDGQTLQEKKSSLSTKQALDIGIQIADGLAAAHDKGIVHRDIKPENIMIRKDGRVQIMDFGLAKLRGASRLTKEGSTVGTAGYMSPEQVQGQDIDHRSDIFSLGVILFEILSGQPPFKGVHETAIAYEVVNVDSPPMSSINPDIPPELDAIVMECLEKDPDERAQAARQVAVDLKRFKRESSRSRTSRTMAASTFPRQSANTAAAPVRDDWNILGSLLPWAITAVVLSSAIVWMMIAPAANTGDSRASRLNISALNSPDQLIVSSDIPNHALSPDGRMIVYTLLEAGGSRLFKRSLDSYAAQPMDGTLNGTSPFFSPDGQWVGFASDGKIKKVNISGGSVITVCDAPGFRGAWWGPDDRIYYSPTYESGLYSIPAGGGEAKVFSVLDTARRDRTHRWPQVLPGGKWVLYTVGDIDHPQYYLESPFVLQSIKTGECRTLDVRGEIARYLEPGYLVVAQNGTLLAAPFSVDDARTTKSLTPVVDHVNASLGSGIADFSISQNGHLSYLSGWVDIDRELVWVSRSGTVTPLPIPPQQFRNARISPDGSKLAISVGVDDGPGQNIFTFDLKTQTLNRLTFIPARQPVWSLDGKYIYYAAGEVGDEGVNKQPADGSSTGELVYRSVFPPGPQSILPDGKKLIVATFGGPTLMDVQVVDLETHVMEPLIATQSFESGGSISVDGKFIAYGSNETGRMEVYVRSFPDLRGKWQISSGGGSAPRFSPTGKELFYIGAGARLMAVPIRTNPAFSSGAPAEILDVSQMYFPTQGMLFNPEVTYDVTRDGSHFLMVRNGPNTTRMQSFNFVYNWVKELEKLDE